MRFETELQFWSRYYKHLREWCLVMLQEIYNDISDRADIL